MDQGRQERRHVDTAVVPQPERQRCGNRKTIRRLRAKANGYRRSQPKAQELISLAKGLGRKEVNRGKEPTYESTAFNLRPLSIPNHKGRDLAPGTRNSILDALDDDLIEWEQWLDEQEREGGS